MVFLSNPPKADKSLRLPCGMQSLFLWGYAQKITRHRTLADKYSEYYIICLRLFFSHALILIKNSNLWVDTIEKEKVIERE
jgi:hypothetical protein